MNKEIEVVASDSFIAGDIDNMNKQLNKAIRNYVDENDRIISIQKLNKLCLKI